AILEVSLDKNRTFGPSYLAGTKLGDQIIGFGALEANNVLNPTALANGFALGIIGQGGVNIPITGADGKQTNITIPPFGVVLQALQTDSDVNVLSRPNILAKENEESEIVVATQIAVPQATLAANTGL